MIAPSPPPAVPGAQPTNARGTVAVAGDAFALLLGALLAPQPTQAVPLPAAPPEGVTPPTTPDVAPASTAGGTATPGTIAPGTTLPGTTAPGTAAPRPTAPDGAASDGTRPEPTIPLVGPPPPLPAAATGLDLDLAPDPSTTAGATIEDGATPVGTPEPPIGMVAVARPDGDVRAAVPPSPPPLADPPAPDLASVPTGSTPTLPRGEGSPRMMSVEPSAAPVPSPPSGPPPEVAAAAIDRSFRAATTPPARRPPVVASRPHATSAPPLLEPGLGPPSPEPAGATDSADVDAIEGLDAPTGRGERAGHEPRVVEAGRPAPPSPALQVGLLIARAGTAGVARMLVQLEPAELGRVEVRLEFGHDNSLRASIAAERSDTLDVLQRDVRVLERGLESAGLRLDDAGLSFSLKDQGQGGSAPHEHAERPIPRAPSADGLGTPGTPADDLPRPVAGLRLVDLRI
jgi:flagellar hook-length control protein FliK